MLPWLTHANLGVVIYLWNYYLSRYSGVCNKIPISITSFRCLCSFFFVMEYFVLNTDWFTYMKNYFQIRKSSCVKMQEVYHLRRILSMACPVQWGTPSWSWGGGSYPVLVLARGGRWWGRRGTMSWFWPGEGKELPQSGPRTGEPLRWEMTLDQRPGTSEQGCHPP